MVRKFYNQTCSIFSLSTSTVRGSSVQNKVSVYSNIPCAIWDKRTSYSETSLAIQTSNNSYEMNLEPQYTNVAIGHVVQIAGVQYKVDDVILHHNSR